jgi:hypothetical protein
MGSAASLFYTADDTEKQTLQRRITPTIEQFEEQQDRWNALADHLIADLNTRSNYPIRTWLQGSYKTATQIRPVRLGEEFDIDLGVYFQWNGNAQDGIYGPKTFKNFVQESLKSYAIAAIDDVEEVEPPRERCARRFSGVNQIGAIPKDCDINFEVTNPLSLPVNSQVFWMVRNEGREAENINDLGHKAGQGLTRAFGLPRYALHGLCG